MVAAGSLWLGASTAALVTGGTFGTLLLGVSSNLLVFYGFYLGWVRQTEDEEEFHEHVEDSERSRRSRSRSEEEREQLQREAGPR